jgi:CRISPR-associated endonuclease/helicase Cas3
MEKLLKKECQIDSELIPKGKEESLEEIMPTQQGWLLYLFMVRILRLCDQKATESLEKYYQP